MMQIDTERAAKAVSRMVEDRQFEGKPARSVILERSYATGIDDVWDALTNGERIPRWFLPVSGDLRLGGRYQLRGNAGGTITDCEPPRRLGLTWEFGGQTSWVFVTLSESDAEQTRLRLEHVAPIDAKAMEFWDQFGPGAVGVGWDLAVMGLGQHLETGESIGHEAGEEWGRSDEGKAFVRLSSKAWSDASAAFGTDPEAAAAAGERTTAFYTGSGDTAG